MILLSVYSASGKNNIYYVVNLDSILFSFRSFKNITGDSDVVNVILREDKKGGWRYKFDEDWLKQLSFSIRHDLLTTNELANVELEEF